MKTKPRLRAGPAAASLPAMPAPEPAPPSSLPKRRGRQRSLAAEKAILTAAIRLLEKKPLRDVTAEAIAARAGVSKATLYKWWPSKAHVALAAFLSRMQTNVAIPDTGSVERDFTEQLKSVIRFYTSPAGRLFRQFIAEGQSDPAFLEQFHRQFLKSRRDTVRVMWQRGVARGEVPGNLDEEIVLDLIYGPMIYRLVAGHAPLNDAIAGTMIATAFGGLKKRK